ncbi:RING-type domain-containing protein [Psidium guajava]|nr:RING-type domain-containing protein [Psidium guajava]
MATRPRAWWRLVLYCLFLGSFDVSSLRCEDTRCRTGSCNGNGDCICKFPDPSTILDGDRLFLGGKFCNEETVMCDGTNSFWCEHGGKCEEIVQGEEYRCQCPPGYTGEHCEYSGARCGGIFCFHGAECLVEGAACECPPGWRGSADCSLPTNSTTGSSKSTSSTGSDQGDGDSDTSGLVLLFLVLCSVGAVLGLAIYAKKWVMRRQRTSPKSQQLSAMQPYCRVVEEDDDNQISAEDEHNDDSHL